MSYAEKTTIAFDRSIRDIVSMLRNFGADSFGQIEDRGSFAIQFFSNERLIRFRVKFPELDQMPSHDGNRRELSDKQRLDRVDQAKRQRGRALMLVIKAKLESIRSEVETFEQAFLANVVMADGQTVFDRIQAPIAAEYQSGVSTTLMLGGPTS